MKSRLKGPSWTLVAALFAAIVACAGLHARGGESGDDCIDKCNKSCEHSSKPGCAHECAIDSGCFD